MLKQNKAYLLFVRPSLLSKADKTTNQTCGYQQKIINAFLLHFEFLKKNFSIILKYFFFSNEKLNTTFLKENQ